MVRRFSPEMTVSQVEGVVSVTTKKREPGNAEGVDLAIIDAT